MASIHCGRSIFFDNANYLNPQQYEQGAERMPFQARFGMMPVLRWAHSSWFSHSLPDYTNEHNGVIVEPRSPERTVSEFVGLFCMLGMVGALSVWGRRYLIAAWWMPGSLWVAMLCANHAARYEQGVWYPYDLPHFFS